MSPVRASDRPSTLPAALKTALFTAVVPGTVAILVPRRLLRGGFEPASGVLAWTGTVLAGAGVFLYLWSAGAFALLGKGTPAPIDPPRRLVVRGAHRFVRNPMYVAVLAVVLGQAVAFASVRLLAYAAALFVFFHGFVVLYEEPTLTRTFGAAYARYRARVPRWLPRPGRRAMSGRG